MTIMSNHLVQIRLSEKPDLNVFLIILSRSLYPKIQTYQMCTIKHFVCK